MKKLWLLCSLALILIVPLYFVIGCGTANKTTTTTVTATTTSATSTTLHGTTNYYGSQSPGDWWSWTLGNSTFVGTNETSGYYYSGTFTDLPTGFKKATITASDDPSLSGFLPHDAYVLEYPNVAMLVKPAGSDDNVIVCAAKATTTPSSGYFNYINLPYQGWDESTYAAYGTTEVVRDAGGLYDFSNRAYNISKAQCYSSQEVDYVLSDGKLSKTGSDLQVFLTPSGAFMGDSGPGQGGFAGAQKETLSITDIVTREYNGFMFEYDTTTGAGTSTPVGGEPHPTTANAIKGFAYASLETGTREAGVDAELVLTSQDSNGVYHGTMDTGSYNYTLHAVIARVSGKILLFAIAKAAGNDNPMNFLVIEK
ncbi:MAG: hypothetical protein JW782_05955 [Candidatus Saganbacteria bacterium]|nr:hypothetical protein [Candidatus Saganbacteria bacterium]